MQENIKLIKFIVVESMESNNYLIVITESLIKIYRKIILKNVSCQIKYKSTKETKIIKPSIQSEDKPQEANIKWTLLNLFYVQGGVIRNVYLIPNIIENINYKYSEKINIFTVSNSNELVHSEIKLSNNQNNLDSQLTMNFSQLSLGLLTINFINSFIVSKDMKMIYVFNTRGVLIYSNNKIELSKTSKLNLIFEIQYEEVLFYNSSQGQTYINNYIDKFKDNKNDVSDFLNETTKENETINSLVGKLKRKYEQSIYFHLVSDEMNKYTNDEIIELDSEISTFYESEKPSQSKNSKSSNFSKNYEIIDDPTVIISDDVNESIDDFSYIYETCSASFNIDESCILLNFFCVNSQKYYLLNIFNENLKSIIKNSEKKSTNLKNYILNNGYNIKDYFDVLLSSNYPFSYTFSPTNYVQLSSESYKNLCENHDPYTSNKLKDIIIRDNLLNLTIKNNNEYDRTYNYFIAISNNRLFFIDSTRKIILASYVFEKKMKKEQLKSNFSIIWLPNNNILISDERNLFRRLELSNFYELLGIPENLV